MLYLVFVFLFIADKPSDINTIIRVMKNRLVETLFIIVNICVEFTENAVKLG